MEEVNKNEDKKGTIGMKFKPFYTMIILTDSSWKLAKRKHGEIEDSANDASFSSSFFSRDTTSTYIYSCCKMSVQSRACVKSVFFLSLFIHYVIVQRMIVGDRVNSNQC